MINQEANQSTKGKSPFYYGYVVLVAVFLIQVFTFGTYSSYGVFFKPILTEFNWTRTLVSGAFSMSSITQALSGIFMGGLNDRLGPRVVMTLCGFLIGLGLILMSQISSAWQLYIFYVVIIGIGMGGRFAPTLSTIARWFVKRRGTMTGIAIAGGGIGGLIVPPAVNWLILSVGWRNSYIIMGILVLVIILLAAQFLRREPTETAQVSFDNYAQIEQGLKQNNIGLSLKEATRTKQFWMMVSIIFCFGLILTTVIVHIVPHITDLGISAARAANMLAIMSGALVTGSIVFGGIADRIGNRQALILCFATMSTALFLLLTVEGVWMLLLFSIIIGFGAGGVSALHSPLIAELFGIRAHGIILGTSNFCYNLGGAVGPSIAGYIFDFSGNYKLAFKICIAVSIIGLVLALLLRPAKK